MGDDDDTRALEFFSRIEDAIITNNFEEDKSNGQIGTILTVTATSISSLSSSSSSNNNHIEEEEDSFSPACDNNIRINNMIVGKEDSDLIGNASKNYTDKEEDGTLGDMDVPLTLTNGKTSINDGNTDQSIETVTVGTYDMAGITTNKQRMKDDNGDGVEGISDDASSRISEPTTPRMKFQPLQPLPGKFLESADTDCSIIQNHTDDSRSKTSSSISINNPSVKEGGLKFMNNIQDPVAASRGVLKDTCGGELEDENLTKITGSASIQQQIMSHTPPTNMSTSYETKHFGKRPRSGSLSERLLVSTELEEKGIINRDQKGILKDLIISGQDNEIQHALDRYEQGDATMLEGMLTSGILSNKATEEIDLLGQLDFDFLNVKEQQEQQEQEQKNGPSNINNNVTTYIGQTSRTGSIASDGIGDLEFDGGVGNWEQGENSDNNRSRSNSTWSALENRTRANSTLSTLELALQQQQHRSRANSAMSIDLDNFRPRSNSLFSPLIGNQTPEVQANFGRWMETSSASGTAGSSEAQPKPTEQQQKLLQQQLHHEHHFQQLLNQQKEKKEKQKPKPKSKSKITKPIRRKAAPGGGGRISKPPSAAAIAKEQLREEKRKVRLLKKEQKEKEKQEKKETKERVKREKQRKKEEMDQHEKEKEKEVHMPGSGRPRSMSDPSLNSRVRADGLLEVERPDGWIGAYSPESRKVRIGRFMEKRNHRVWTKTVKYDVRKNFADSRLRVKGRFVKKDDELLMRELMSLT